MQYKIESGIPIPDAEYGTITQILMSMKAGDSILMPVNKAGSFQQMALRKGVKVIRRREGDQCRVWRTE